MASISAPTLLATFQTSHASSSNNRHVTLAPVHGSQGKLAVAAVQGDGIWTYDLKTLRPTTSYIVPPSTVFSTSALSFMRPPPTAGQAKGKGKALPQGVGEDAEMNFSAGSEDTEEKEPQRTTVIGIQGGGKGDKGKQGAELWIWRREDDEKKTVPLNDALQSLHHLLSSKYPVLAVASNGDFFLLDTFDELVPLPHNVPISNIVAGKIISSSADACGVVIVSKDGRIRSLRVDHPRDGPISARLTSETRIGQKGDALAIADIGEDGTVTAMSTTNHLFSRSLRQNSSAGIRAMQISNQNDSPALASVPSPTSLILHTVNKPTNTLLLSSSSSDSPIVLATTDLSSFSTHGNIPQISLIGKSSSSTYTATFIVWHQHGEGDSGRSVIYTCELSLPEKGFGLNVLLGTKERTELYLGSGSVKEDKTVAVEELPADASRPKKRDQRDLGILLEGSLSEKSWKIVRHLMRDTMTLPSATIVTILKRAIADNRLGDAYSDLLSLPPPAVDFRFEMRKNVTAEEATQLLQQLVDWAAAWCDNRLKGLGWPDGSSVDKPDASLPTLDSVLAHSSLLLDSHLPLLVEHAPAAPLLGSLSTSITPLLMLQAEIRQLRAPIDALVTLSKREERRRAEIKAKKESMKQVIPQSGGTGGKKGKYPGMPRSETSGAMLPGEDFGKWKVEDFVF